MKQCILLNIVVLLSAISASHAVAAEPVAVVELFTSEGCSSCPPAERVLGDVVASAAKNHQRVFTLAFHVDYWDRLGWKDQFSTAAASQRQYDYAGALRVSNVYTPQMIVNGTAQFVGSDRAAAKQAIAAALQQPAAAEVHVAAAVGTDQQWRVSGNVSGASASSRITVAVVEQKLSTHIKAGENSGRTVAEPSVVRWFTTVAMPADGTFDVHVPTQTLVDSANTSVVAFVQNERGAVTGAASGSWPALR